MWFILPRGWDEIYLSKKPPTVVLLRGGAADHPEPVKLGETDGTRI